MLHELACSHSPKQHNDKLTPTFIKKKFTSLICIREENTNLSITKKNEVKSQLSKKISLETDKYLVENNCPTKDLRCIAFHSYKLIKSVFESNPSQFSGIPGQSQVQNSIKNFI